MAIIKSLNGQFPKENPTVGDILDFGSGGQYKKTGESTYTPIPIQNTSASSQRSARPTGNPYLDASGNVISPTNPTLTLNAENQRATERQAQEQALSATLMGIDQEMAQKYRELDERARKDYASVGAVNLRSGLAGSTFGESNVRGAVENVRKEKGYIDEYISAKKAAAQSRAAQAFTEVEQRYQDRLKQARDEQGNLIQRSVEFDERNRARAKENLSAIAKSGSVTYDQWIDSDLRKELLEQTGENEYIVDSLFKANMPEAIKPRTIENYTSDVDGSAILNRIIINPDGTISEQNTKLNIPYQTIAGNKPIEVGGNLVVPDGRGGYKTVFQKKESAGDVTGVDGVESGMSVNDKLSFLEGAIENANKASSGAGVSGIKKFLGDTFVGDTKFRQLESYTNTIRTNLLTLATDPAIKKFFGPQMSNADVQMMLSTASTLDPEKNTPDQIRKELVRISGVVKKLKDAAGIQMQQKIVIAPDGTEIEIID